MVQTFSSGPQAEPEPSRHPPPMIGDVWGGFSAMLVALPSAIAFGVTIFSPLGGDSGAQGAMAGMLGVTVLGLVAGLLGGTKRLISAPCAPAAAVLSAMTIEMMGQGQPVMTILVSLFLVALLSSVIQLGFGVLRLGGLINYMPFPVVSGYMSGVGVVIILSQLPKWLAFPKEMGLWHGTTNPNHWLLPSVVIGLATALGMWLMPRMVKNVPSVILGLVAGVLAYWALAMTGWSELRTLAGNGLVIGPIKAAGPDVAGAMAAMWQALLEMRGIPVEPVFVTALTLSVLLSIDTLKTCVVLDTITGSQHDPNRELIGQGLGNLVSALFGGVPGAGTMGASLVNEASGGTTKLSSVFQGLWSLVVVVLLSTLVAWVPVSALAAILVVIGLHMIDWSSFKLLHSRDTAVDFAVIVLVAIAANTIGLIAASGLGIALSILMFIKEQSHTSTLRRRSLGNELFSKRVRLPDERAFLEHSGKLTAIYELQGSLFFGTTNQLFLSIKPDAKQVRFLVLDFMHVQSLDFTAGHIIERLSHMLAQHNGILVLSHLPAKLPNGRDLRSYVDHLGLSANPSVKIFEHFSDALEWVENETLRRAGRITLSQTSLPLSRFDLVQSMGKQDLALLETCLVRRVYQPGELIFSTSTTGHELMLISRGEVKMSLPIEGRTPVHLATLGAGHMFGEMSFLEQQPHSAEVKAVTDTELICLNRESFDAAFANNAAIVASVMTRVARSIAHRLRHNNNEIQEFRLV